MPARIRGGDTEELEDNSSESEPPLPSLLLSDGDVEVLQAWMFVHKVEDNVEIVR